MMKKTFVVIILIVLTYSISYSQASKFDSELHRSSSLDERYQKNLELKNKLIFDENRFSLKDSTVNSIPQENRESQNLKSPFLGGVMSGLIPGAGQFYAKSYIKSAAFLAVEVGLWVAYSVFQKKGNDQTDYFQNYANQNWDMRKYAAWLKVQGYQKSGDIDLSKPDDILRAQINACEEINFSHTLPHPGEQQYYEVIGKYQNFLAGWSTADPNVITKNNYLNYKLPQVDQYMTDRQQANTYYDRGSLMLTVVIINHLISAADGVWSVIRYNSKFTSVKSDINVQGHYSYNLQRTVIVPHLNVSVNF
jgi:hypothetical protein